MKAKLLNRRNENLPPKHNTTLGKWHLKVDNGANGVFDCEIDWGKYPLRTPNIITAQYVLENWWGKEPILQMVELSSTKYRMASTLLRVMLLVEEFFPQKAFNEIEFCEWQKVVQLMLFYILDDTDRNKKSLKQVKAPLAKQQLERTITVLKRWFSTYQDGFVDDGPEFEITTQDAEPLIKSEFKSQNINFSAWKEGGSFGSIPFVIAHLLLADAIATIESNHTKKVLAYFKIAREAYDSSHIKQFWSTENSCPFAEYRITGNVKSLAEKVKNSQFTPVRYGTYKNIAAPLHNELRKITQEVEPTFPWKNFSQLHIEYNTIRTAVLVIFLSVMGKRGPSEVKTLRGQDVFPPSKDIGQHAIFTPQINKTNKGLREKQGVTDFISDSLNVILKLGYSDKSETSIPLFSQLFTPNQAKKPEEHIKPISTTELSSNIKKYYEQFCNRVSNSLDFNPKDLHGKITSHQFRHSFAEFSLRRFDGNVEELIRQHFCHKYNKYSWLKRYTADKLDSKRLNSINKAYIRELVPRILIDSDLDPDFVGGMALYIKQTLGEKVSSLPPSEIENYIDEFCHEIDSITPHEYGWCIQHKNFRSAAQCADKTGQPAPSGTTHGKCIRCINFCSSRRSHFHKQKQIMLNHLDFIEQDTWKIPSLVDASKNAVQDTQKLFPELKEFGGIE